ncbi:MAG: YebC/PmpR family DNA-binding transcriptional regulator, partial [Pseudomonadota bacterium]
HRKGRQDAKRSKEWSKCSRAIIVAAKNGGGDPAMNLTLRYAIDEAKAANMPKDTIQKAIEKGAGGGDGNAYEEILYEGYGPAGVAVLVEALTDNRNRTATAVRTAFSKNGGNLGTEGSVAHGFERLGYIEYGAEAGTEDKVLEAALEAGAEDISSSEDGHEIWTAAEDLHEVSSNLEKALGEAKEVKLAWKPNITVEMDEKGAGTLLKLIDTLDDDDDVQTVWGNYEIPDAVMEKLDA